MVFPEVSIVKVATVGASAAPKLKVPAAPLAKAPNPERAVETVAAPLFVSVTPVATEIVAMDCVPARACAAVIVKVAVPVIATVPVELWVMPFRISIFVLAPFSVPLETDTAPEKRFTPVSLSRVKVPPFTVVVPATTRR